MRQTYMRFNVRTESRKKQSYGTPKSYFHGEVAKDASEYVDEIAQQRNITRTYALTVIIREHRDLHYRKSLQPIDNNS